MITALLAWFASCLAKAQTKVSLIQTDYYLRSYGTTAWYLWATDTPPINTLYTDPQTGVSVLADAVIYMDQAGQQIKVLFRTGQVKILALPQ